MKDFHKVLLAAAFLAAASFAQEPSPESFPADEVPENAASEPVAPENAASEPVAPENAVSEPVAPENAASEPVAPENAAPVALASAAVAQKSEPLEISLKWGARLGLGISSYRNHVALRTSDGAHALKLGPSVAFSIGAASQIGLNELVSISPELQYSFYSSQSEVVVENPNAMSSLHEVGVYTHALELPVLAHFNFGMLYAEIGPQIGFNLYSKIYKNADYYRPDRNLFAFGIAAGGGVNLSDVLIGARLYFGFLEYAKDAKGIPWSFQLSVSPFIF